MGGHVLINLVRVIARGLHDCVSVYVFTGASYE
jgi:hypothetical protein